MNNSKINLTETAFRTVVAIFIGMLIVACGGGGGSGDKTGLSNSFSISGAVSGVQVAVPISLIGGGTPVTVNSDPNNNGNFSFNNLSIGSYTVAPSLTDYTFSPSSAVVAVPGDKTSGVNFTATRNTIPAYTLSGTVTGGIKQNVLITLSGSGNATTKTDISGNYIFSGLTANNGYIITPSMLGYTFSPAPPTVVISNAKVTGINFTSTGMLNDTGITSAHCYQATSDTLVACNSAGATALNNLQDGMVGRDANVASNIANDGTLGFSFIQVCNSGQLVGTGTCPAAPVLGVLLSNWGCTQDNVTGLMWEVKTADGGLRDWNKTYTNYSVAFNPTNLYGTATDATGYVTAVNAAGLCGYNDWRLPNTDELQSIMDYSVPPPGPTVDATWFPNTKGDTFWPGTSMIFVLNASWVVGFGYNSGAVEANMARSNAFRVRLVRDGL
jgi:hypothetical protein